MHAVQRMGILARLAFYYKMKDITGKVLPLRIWLEPTNKCNLRCPLCPQSADATSERGFMDGDLYRKIIDEIQHFSYDINLSHRGESLFHEEIIDFIHYANSKGLKTRIHTNGTYLDRALSKAVIESGLDFLSFSFDGFDKELYEKSRVGATYEETLENIVQFLHLKKEASSRTPFTVIQVIQTDSLRGDRFLEQKEAFLKNFKDLPLNKLYVKDPHNWGGIIHDETAEKLAVSQRYSPCTFCWYSLTILWDGTVVPCPQDFYGKLEMGNVREQTISDIWHGESMQQLRKAFIARSIEGVQPCETCDRLFRKRFLGIPQVNMREFLTEQIFGYDMLRKIYKKK